MANFGSRSFSPKERSFLEQVAAKLPPSDSDRLLHDVEIACVSEDGDFLSVELPNYLRPEYRGHHNLDYEGKMRAADGGAVSALVNMDPNNRLLEVEFIFWESSGGVAPDWSTLSIVPKPPLGAPKW